MHRRTADAIIYALRSASLPIAALAIVNSGLLIVAHARENRHPALRVYTVRILLMVVIDSVAAVCALWGTGWEPHIDMYVRDIIHFVVELYESLVIFSFLQFVLVCSCGPERLASKFARRGRPSDKARPPQVVLAAAAAGNDVEAGGGGRADPAETSPGPPAAARALGAEAHVPRKLKHLPPFNRLLPPWRSGKQMLRCCVVGTLSYVVVGATLAALGFFLLVTPGGKQAKGTIWKVSSGVLSAAQAVAILALAELAVNVKEEISLLRPYGKFLSVKFVVFFAFWQGLLLGALERMGVFQPFEAGCGGSCARQVIQNSLICVEMLVASIIHFHVFPPHDYLKLLAQTRLQDGDDGSPVSLGSPATVAEVLDIRDIFHTALQLRPNRSRTASGGAAAADAVARAAAMAEADTCSLYEAREGTSGSPVSNSYRSGGGAADKTPGPSGPLGGAEGTKLSI